MSINEIIIGAVSPIVPVCVPDLYDGESQEYCTFDYSTIGIHFGDDGPEALRYLVSLHWFLPLGENPMAKRKQLCRALHGAGLTWPEVTPAGDGTCQHYVFECEWAEGVDDA